MVKQRSVGPLEQVGPFCWRVPPDFKPGMRVEGRIYADDRLIEDILGDPALEQVAHVAFLPGIQGASLAMPDIHAGYGFPIGGVCATDPDEGGVISPGGVGYDINCGVRLMRTNLCYRDIKRQLEPLIDRLFREIPAGTGRSGKYHYSSRQLRRLMQQGVPFLQEQGLATEGDVHHTEAGGCLEGADPDQVSPRAWERGADQCGTLGSGNHFLEIQVVDVVFDAAAARAMGLEKDSVCVMIHSGSRGLGYQVCDDALKRLRGVPARYGIELPDRQLACAPIDSPEGQAYQGAMAAAANFAWCNRQLLMWQAREAFAAVLGSDWQRLQMNLIYDVAHNIAKFERHEIGGSMRRVCVHRKGATRAFPADHPETPAAYRQIGQPVIIPGDMGRFSWVLVGRPGSMQQTFGSCCHGAGRRLSRTAAVKQTKGRRIDQELARQGILARARSRRGLAEECSEAYKDVNRVVDVVHGADLAAKVARLRPLAVIKG